MTLERVALMPRGGNRVDRLARRTGGGYLARGFGVAPTDVDVFGRPDMDRVDVEVSA